MAKPKKFDYFDAFTEQIDIALEEAEILIETLENFTTAEAVREVMDRAHAIEHRGDLVNRDIFMGVSKDFITPIDREDILMLAQDLDTITDKLEGVIQRFYMLDVHVVHDKAMDFAIIIRKSLKALRKSMEHFREFKKIKKVQHLAEDVNELEEQADRLYIEAVRELYTKDANNPMRVQVWSLIFNRLEDTCDACKTAAEAMSTIMLKNV